MNQDMGGILSDCGRRFLSLGFLILLLGIGSGALFHGSPAIAGRTETDDVGKTRGVPDLLERPAIKVEHPEQRVLLGIAKNNDRLVTVGERGIIAFSDDNGHTWRQAKVLTSVTLTAVTFPVKDIGWAIGHAGTVLHTSDGGETWTRQLDGVSAAQIAYDGAQAYAANTSPDDPLAKRYLSEAKLLIDDGPDKPFLDLHFSNEKEGIIVGAYGLIFHTSDGGKTWISWMTRVDNPDGFHFYVVQKNKNVIYLAGEQGLCLRSKDSGKSFQKIDTGYRGSYFTSTIMGEDVFIIAGMRGNVYRSMGDGAMAFKKMEVPVPVSILSCLTMEEASVLLVNQAGLILGNNPGRPNRFNVIGAPRLKSMVAAVIQLDENVLLGVGNKGVVRIPLPIEKAENIKGEF